MKTKLTLVFCALAAAASADVGTTASVVTTLSGKTYRSVQISQVTPDGVYFRHANGAGKVLYADLPADIRENLGFDAKKAEVYEKDCAERRAKERLAAIERDKEAAKAQANAAIAYAAQANVATAQLALATAQQAAAGAYGYGYASTYPVVWGSGGWGWYDERVPSPSYGGRAYYTVRRWVRQPYTFQEPFRAGQIASSVPYSPNQVGNAPFTNGVPALGASFVSQIGSYRPRITSTSTHSLSSPPVISRSGPPQCAPGGPPGGGGGRSR